MNRVINTTVLSNFASIGRLTLLRDTIGPLYLPVDVYDEILAGQLAGYAFYDGFERYIAPLSPDGWLRLVSMIDEELTIFLSLLSHLHRGEAACLSIARQRGWGVLTDDRAARRQAYRWRIPLAGTIGILLLAVQDNRLSLDEGNVLLRRMIVQAHYRSPTEDLGSLLP